jgi:hypothetical protein
MTEGEGCAATKTFFEPRPQALIWILVKNYKSKALLPSEVAPTSIKRHCL